MTTHAHPANSVSQIARTVHCFFFSKSSLLLSFLWFKDMPGSASLSSKVRRRISVSKICSASQIIS